mmetsp:Transcript_9347/g.32488  ORF Transcript_9347/g.32488 Transcript_9347/m.32488 type:complete len:385 (-) Transcript_9347:427-1581(-)
MQAFRDAYVQKCRDFVCDPVAPLLAALDAAIAQGLTLSYIKLNGNDKELFNNRLRYIQVFALAEALHDVKFVEELDLSYNGIDDAGAATIERLLKFNTSLRALNLSGNSIGADGASKIAGVLAGNASGSGAPLASLSLANNEIGEVGGMRIAQALRSNTTLRDLDLGSTELGMKAVVSIVTALNEANRTLECLNLEDIRMFSVQQETSTHVARMLAVNPTLQVLKVGKHRVRDLGAETLVAYGLVCNRTLTVLDLQFNELTEEAGSSLARLLTENASVTDLNLAGNRLADNGAAAIAAALPMNDTLARIDLSSNRINDKGLCAVAEGVARASTVLGSVSLWGNAFGLFSSEKYMALQEERPEVAMDFVPQVTSEGNIHIARQNA